VRGLVKQFICLLFVLTLALAGGDKAPAKQAEQSALENNQCVSTFTFRGRSSSYSPFFKIVRSQSSYTCPFIAAQDKEVTLLFEPVGSTCSPPKIAGAAAISKSISEAELRKLLDQCAYNGSIGISKARGDTSDVYIWEWPKNFSVEDGVNVKSLIYAGLPINNYSHVNDLQCFEVPTSYKGSLRDEARKLGLKLNIKSETRYAKTECEAVMPEKYQTPYFGITRP
jgi:hypothetical protein